MNNNEPASQVSMFLTADCATRSSSSNSSADLSDCEGANAATDASLSSGNR